MKKATSMPNKLYKDNNAKTQFPGWFDLAKLWMCNHFKNETAVVIFHPLNTTENISERWKLLESIGVTSNDAVFAEFVVVQKPLYEAMSTCDNIPSDLMFAMVWNGSEFVHENT